jgi:hypothetical protein
VYPWFKTAAEMAAIREKKAVDKQVHIQTHGTKCCVCDLLSVAPLVKVERALPAHKFFVREMARKESGASGREYVHGSCAKRLQAHPRSFIGGKKPPSPAPRTKLVITAVA